MNTNARPRLALFIRATTLSGITVYHPANKAAVDACDVLGRRAIPETVMPQLREHGFDPRLGNGEPIGRVDIEA